MGFAQGWPGQIFSIICAIIERVYVMGKLFYCLSFKWIKDLKAARKQRKDRKRIAYCEKRWEMKLRGLR